MELKGDPDAGCERILEKIRISEDQILTGLDTLYESLPTQVFKTMRKALPGIKMAICFFKIFSHQHKDGLEFTCSQNG